MITLRWFRLISCFVALTATLHSSSACVIPLPLPEPEEPEHEIWIDSLGFNDISGKLEYLVGVEVELFESNQTAECTCALNLGNPATPVPGSVTVTQAMISIANLVTHEKSGEESEFEFEEEIEIEDELEDEFEVGSETYGFKVEVDSVESEELEPDEVHKLFFKLEVSPDDVESLRNVPIRFAAGSNMPGHDLMVLGGYKTTLNLPAVAVDMTWDGQGDGNWTDNRWNAAGFPTQFNNVAIVASKVTVSGTQLARSTSVNSGVLEVAGTLVSPVTVNPEATLAGNGTIAGDVANQGSITPGLSTGPLTITGDYVQTSSGSLRLDIGRLGPVIERDALLVGGTAVLAGALDIRTIAGFTDPERRGLLHDIQLVAAGEVSGRFDEVRFNGVTVTPDFVLANGSPRSHAGNGLFRTIEYDAAGVHLLNYLALPGDANGDRLFDSTDLIQVFQFGQYEDNTPGNSSWTSGDWNGSSDFDSGDLIAAFQTGTYSAGGNANVIPEPSGLVLLGLGLLTILAYRSFNPEPTATAWSGMDYPHGEPSTLHAVAVGSGLNEVRARRVHTTE